MLRPERAWLSTTGTDDNAETTPKDIPVAPAADQWARVFRRPTLKSNDEEGEA
jgi:hypothetical protein